MLLIAGAAVVAYLWQQQNGQDGASQDGQSQDSQSEGGQDSGGDMAATGISQAGLDFIKRHEGFRAFSYPDAQGRSIGYGHFIKPGEQFNEPISQADADTLLANDTQGAVNAVRAGAAVALNQCQFDALCDFAYNAGAGALASSTLLQMVNSGDMAGAAGQFGRWIYTHDTAGNKVVSTALQARRADEADLFANGNYGA